MNLDNLNVSRTVKPALDWDDPLSFGKHSGRTCRQIREEHEDTSYIIFLYERDIITLKGGLKDFIERKVLENETGIMKMRKEYDTEEHVDLPWDE